MPGYRAGPAAVLPSDAVRPNVVIGAGKSSSHIGVCSDSDVIHVIMTSERRFCNGIPHRLEETFAPLNFSYSAQARHYDKRLYNSSAAALVRLLPPVDLYQGNDRYPDPTMREDLDPDLDRDPNRPAPPSPHDLTCTALAFAQFNHYDS